MERFTMQDLRVMNRGFSIIELMVALTLGLILIAGVVQVFLGNRQAQRSEQAVSRVEENGRVALDMIVQDLRMAGFSGCATQLKIEIVSSNLFSLSGKGHPEISGPNVPTATSKFQDKSMRGYVRSSGGWTPALPADLSTGGIVNAHVGSDVVAIYYGKDSSARIDGAGDVTGVGAVALKRNQALFNQNDLLIFSNCDHADLVKITNTPSKTATTISVEHSSTGNADDRLIGVYNDKSLILEYVERVYYVRDTLRKNPRGDAIYSLYRRQNGVEEELIEGVEFLKLVYGQLLDDGKIRYVAADDASFDPLRIVSVRVGILAQSYDAVRTSNDATTYSLPGASIGNATTVKHSGGETLRRTFTATVEVRNRLQL
jgi:type IV pilus assembly protein PilW